MRLLTIARPRETITLILGKYQQVTLLILVVFCMLFSVPAIAAESGDGERTQSKSSAPIMKTGFLFSGGPETNPSNAGKSGKHVKRSRHATLNLNQLRKPSGIGFKNQQVLNLFDDTVLVAIKDRETRNASGSVTWIGHIEGVEHGSVIMVVRDEIMIAKVAMPGAVYEISLEADGTQVIKELDQAEFIDHETEVPEVVEEPGQGPAGYAAENDAVEDVAADDGSVLDVLVVYSPQARAAAGSVVAIESTIELGVAETNIAYESSNVSQRLDLVHMYESPDAQLSGFSANLSGVRHPSDSYLDGVHALRDQYHADFVQLIIEDSTSCGLAYLQSIPAHSAFEYSAFGVTHRNCVVGNYSFAHELGHNMGLRHDWYVDQNVTPHTWAHGFTNPPDQWRTVMAYSNHCSAASGSYCTRLAYFSNPGNVRNGDPMGVTGGTASNCIQGALSPDPNSCDADSHSVLNSNALTNSRYRASKITWTGNSTDWNQLSNWTMDQGVPGSTSPVSRVPRSIDDVRIPTTPTGGNFPTISTGTHNARNVVVDAGATLTMTGGTLNVRGNWEEQGSGSFNGSAGTVVFLGDLDQSIAVNGSSVFANLTIGDGQSTQTVDLLNNLDVSGDFTLQNGATFSAFGSLDVGGNFTLQTGTTFFAYNNLDVNGDFILLGGATLAANTHTINVAGDWSDQGGGFSPGTSTVIFDGASQTIDKLTTQILLDEPFDEADGTGCCSSGNLPGGWVRQHSAGSGFLSGDVSGWGGNAGAAVRWNNSADAWLHTSSIAMRTDANYEIEYKYRSLFSGTTHDFSVSVGTAQTSASMGAALGTVTNAGNTSYLTLSDSFTVASDGIYYLGFRSQQNSGAGYAVIDEIMLREVAPMAFYNLQVSSTGSATIIQDLVVNNDLTINGGGTLDLNSKDLTVEGMLNNIGTLKQTQTTPNSVATEFLRIKNAAGSTDKYFGVEITPSTGSMGTTSVAIRGGGGIDWVQRSYEITPATDQTALTRFYYRLLDQNGQLNPIVFHWNGSSWDNLGTSLSGGSGDGMYVETTTSDYSPFVLSDDTPTHASIGKVSLDYVSVVSTLKNLMRGSNDLELLSNLLTSLNPHLAGSLGDADIDRWLTALAHELDPDGDSLVAVLAWETLEEIGTIGFYVERQLTNGDWKQINNVMLPGFIFAPMGAEYLLFDPDVGQLPEYLYRLIEVEARGKKIQHGPWLLRLRH